jgi:predicted RNA binding protein YcfA (HicA-like mRNA interferase family)
MKVRDLIRLLESSGWLPVGTLKAILRSAGLEGEEEDR